MSKEYWVISYSLFYDYWYETGGRRWLPLVLDFAQWASQWMETALVSKRQCIAGDRKRKKHKWGGKKGWYLSVDPGLQFKHAWQTRQHHQHSTSVLDVGSGHETWAFDRGTHGLRVDEPSKHQGCMGFSLKWPQHTAKAWVCHVHLSSQLQRPQVLMMT